MNNSFLDRHQGVRDFFGLIVFVVLVLLGTVLINAFVFRSFNVEGASMENTLHTGDRLIVNRVPITLGQVTSDRYVPERGQIIVFKNPNFGEFSTPEEYIVKRVIALPGERIVLNNDQFTVYNDENPDGFNPDDSATHGHPKSPTTMIDPIDEIVPEGTLFVSGDNRIGDASLDSRNGLGYIPLYDVVGPVALRIFPFDQFGTF